MTHPARLDSIGNNVRLMQQFAAALLLVAICHAQEQSTTTVSTSASLEKLVSTLLYDIARRPSNAIPDAVLNTTRCVVLISGAARNANKTDAMAACRDADAKWERPTAAIFSPAQPQSQQARQKTLLILLMTDAASHALVTTGVMLDKNNTKPGPLVRNSPVVATNDFRDAALMYQYDAPVLLAAQGYGKLTLNRGGGGRNQPRPVAATFVRGTALRAVESFFNTITPIGIIIHHSSTLPQTGKPPSSVDEIDRFHQARGFDIVCQGREYHVAYHYLILADGTVRRGRPERCEGAHARGYNSYLGIAVLGDFAFEDKSRGDQGRRHPTPQQMHSLEALCRRLMKEYNIPIQRIVRHSDIGITRCPGDGFPFETFLNELAAR